MRQSPILKIVAAHLTGRKRQSIVSMLGVTFGITIFIFQAGMISGFQTEFIETVINITPHVHVYNEKKKSESPIISRAYATGNYWFSVRNQKEKQDKDRIKNGLQIAGIIEQLDGIEGVSPSLSTQAIFKLGISDVSGVVNGVNILKENQLFNIEKNMLQGSVIRLETVNNGIIIGSGLAKSIGAKLNDNINVVSPKGVSLTMKVVGINQSRLKELDDKRAFVSLHNAQKLLRVNGSYITDINIKVKEIDEATVVADELERRFGYKAEDWKEVNAPTFNVFRIQKVVTYLVIASIMLVSGFGIFNILTMMIYEKMTDIAILKAIGYTNGDIRLIFLMESLIIGFTGGLLGLLFGFVLSFIVSSIPILEGGFINTRYLKINFDALFYLTAFIFGLITTGIAGLLPARKAAKVDPINIIRGQ